MVLFFNSVIKLQFVRVKIQVTLHFPLKTVEQRWGNDNNNNIPGGRLTFGQPAFTGHTRKVSTKNLWRTFGTPLRSLWETFEKPLDIRSRIYSMWNILIIDNALMEPENFQAWRQRLKRIRQTSAILPLPSEERNWVAILLLHATVL